MLRPFDPAIDDDNVQPSRRPPRIQDPSGPSRMIPYTGYQPVQEFPGQHNAQYQSFYEPSMVIRTANGQLVRVEPYRDLPLQDARPPQQPVSYPSSSDQATRAATPSTPAQGSQAPHQERSQSVAQAQPVTTVRNDGFPQNVGPGSNVHPSLQLRPGPLNAANLQPQFAPYLPFQPVMNGNRGQQTLDMSRFVPAPNPNYQADPAHPMTLAQGSHFHQPVHQYPEPHDLFSTMVGAVPSTELNALPNSHNCQCGPGCECVFCATHPLNAATRERVQDLSQIMATDNYWPPNQLSRPQSGYGAAPTNATNTDAVLGQGYLPLNEDYFHSAPIQWQNAPIQVPELQPTFDEGALVANGDHANEVHPRTMRSSQYITMEYPVNSNCTDATGTCLCGSDCGCIGCVTHQGHIELPN